MFILNQIKKKPVFLFHIYIFLYIYIYIYNFYFENLIYKWINQFKN